MTMTFKDLAKTAAEAETLAQEGTIDLQMGSDGIAVAAALFLWLDEHASEADKAVIARRVAVALGLEAP